MTGPMRLALDRLSGALEAKARRPTNSPTPATTRTASIGIRTVGDQDDDRIGDEDQPGRAEEERDRTATIVPRAGGARRAVGARRAAGRRADRRSRIGQPCARCSPTR